MSKDIKLVDFNSTKKSISHAIYIIGMAICAIGIIIPFLLKDYYTMIAVGITMIVSTISYLTFFLRGKYSLFMGIMAVILSVLLFPSIMLTTNYPQQAILYQFIVPVIWTLALADTDKISFWPIVSGIFMSLADGHKLGKTISLTQGAEYAVIYFIIYIFLYCITRIYIRSAFYAFNQVSKAVKTDFLTKAHNRYGITNKIDELIQNNIPFYLVYLDLDNFKNVNDTLGHSAGDKILIAMANLWRDRIDQGDSIVGRLGGDEFAIVIESSDEQYVRSYLKKALYEISHSNNDSLRSVTVSAGIVAFPKDAQTSQDLYMYADTSLYKAKNSGKNTYQFFTKKVFEEIVKEFNLKSIAEKALSNKDFYLVYQPQIDVKTNKVYGFESLLRVKDEKISIQELINVAEKSPLIYDIDLYVLDLAMQDCKPLVEKNKDILVSVNISGKHLTYKNLAKDIEELLHKNNFPAENLCIEITESAFIKSLELAKKTVHDINALGIKLALDDFGIGYSSLAYLKELSVDHIKIEKFFIDNMFKENEKNRLADIIIDIGHLFDYKVIAEGVEMPSQKDYLINNKCDIIQGYLYSKPLSIEDAIKICSCKLKPSK